MDGGRPSSGSRLVAVVVDVVVALRMILDTTHDIQHTTYVYTAAILSVSHTNGRSTKRLPSFSSLLVISVLSSAG